MKHQKGLSLISTLIVGLILMAGLVLCFKLVPVYVEYFGVQKTFSKIISATDPAASASEFRNAFSKYAIIDDLQSVDVQTILVTKDSGQATMQVAYRREVPLFANVGLYFDFDVTSK